MKQYLRNLANTSLLIAGMVIGGNAIAQPIKTEIKAYEQKEGFPREEIMLQYNNKRIVMIDGGTKGELDGIPDVAYVKHLGKPLKIISDKNKLKFEYAPLMSEAKKDVLKKHVDILTDIINGFDTSGKIIVKRVSGNTTYLEIKASDGTLYVVGDVGNKGIADQLWVFDHKNDVVKITSEASPETKALISKIPLNRTPLTALGKN